MIKNTLELNIIRQEPITYRFLSNGTLYDIAIENSQINLQKGNVIDGSLSNLYLRFQDDFSYITLLNGPHLKSVTWCDEGVIYEGDYQDLTYKVTMSLYPKGWTYDVELKSDKPVICDLYYGQDIGIQDANGILNNEAYIVQYIDYKAFYSDNGYTLCARQNQGRPTYFQMGLNKKTVGFVTDSMQFFTPSQKIDGKAHALDKPLLPNVVYQYESSYLTLQSQLFEVTKKGVKLQFYANVQAEHQEAIKEPKSVHFTKKTLIQEKTVMIQESLLSHAKLLSGNPLNSEEINQLYPDRLHEEWQDSQLLSWFLEDHTHVMTLQKEALLERPQGHIIIQGELLKASNNVLSTTAYMPGVFLSHLTLGNTSFHKFLGDHRHPLMLHKMAGLRLYIKQDGVYNLLATPSLFEVGFQHVTWWYVFNEDTIKISTYGDIHSTEVHLEFRSLSNISYDLIATCHLVMGSQEWSGDIPIKYHDQGFSIHPPKSSMIEEQYPELTYQFSSSVPIDFDVNSPGLLTGQIQSKTTFTFSVSAAFKEPIHQSMLLNKVRQNGLVFYESLFKNISPWKHSDFKSSDKPLLYWYTHNALVHYASPHGLEQYNGAAWGTRDVCQGPFELFSALQIDAPLKHILLTVYGRQFLETGDFPQWFMYDNYRFIQAHESHGDIIFWPLKALAYYLEQTNDLSILEETIPYFSLNQQSFGTPKTLYEHVKHQIKTMIENTINDLPIYGGGDWDDTLQPANQTLKDRMVSGWTTALMIQVLESFSEVIKDYDNAYALEILTYAQKVKESRKQYLIPDDIPAGFAVFNGHTEYLLHPRDEVTGLSYRLLPLIRSMIAGLTTNEEIINYTDIIETHLKFPDGVRLMNTPVTYKGGENNYFQRAETAANFGREIGLQYVHGHIRYLEAMWRTGQKEKAIEALKMIHPIEYHKNVPKALPRQRNTYFSSSDASFNDRYQAKREFDKLKSGSVPVKGGWRIYSSGPGILIHQLIIGLWDIDRNSNNK